MNLKYQLLLQMTHAIYLKMFEMHLKRCWEGGKELSQFYKLRGIDTCSRLSPYFVPGRQLWQLPVCYSMHNFLPSSADPIWQGGQIHFWQDCPPYQWIHFSLCYRQCTSSSRRLARETTLFKSFAFLVKSNFPLQCRPSFFHFQEINMQQNLFFFLLFHVQGWQKEKKCL